MSIAPARKTALAALGRVRRDAAFSGPVLASALGTAALSPADAALATRLTYGVLAAEGVLDEALNRHVRGQLEPQVRDVLRLAAFELLFGRAPAYAVVDQAVGAVRGMRRQAAGMANAVLRRIADEADSFPWGDPETDLAALARASGHPRWIVDRVLADLGGAAAREMLACGLEPAPTYIRLNPFAGDRADALRALEPAEAEPSPPDADCFVLGRPSAAFRTADAGRSWFPMDAAAQMAPLACRPLPGATVLDVGAGRGNKTMCIQALAVRAGGPAKVTAIDVHPAKVDALATRLTSAGVPDVETRVADGARLTESFARQSFDVALVDAPCSGLGTLRRYPEKRWRLDPDTPQRLQALQSALLESAAHVVRPGGRLVYSTCSVARQENDAVVEAFLGGERGTGFAIEPLGDIVPEEWSRFRTQQGFFQSWATSGGPDGHFVAVLRRVEE